MKNDSKVAGYLFVLGATAIWSGNFIIARGLNDIIHPVELAFWRWLVAVLAFLPFGLKPLMAEWKILKKNIPYLVLTSVLGITIFNTLIYFAGQTTTALNLSLISITFPIFIIILSRILFGEKITVPRLFGIILVISGIVFLVTGGDISKLTGISFSLGDLWMLIAAFTFALYSIQLRRKPEGLGIRSLQMATFITGLIFLSPFFLWKTLAIPHSAFETRTILSILYVGIFASLIAFIFWNKAIVKIGPTKSGMVYYTLPLFSGVLAFLVLKESVTVVHLISAVLIISGIITANSAGKKG